MTQMTMRERMLAFIQRRGHDRVPFAQYSGLGGPNEEIWDAVGRGNMGILSWTQVCGAEHPNCRLEAEDIERGDLRGRRTIMHTPAGSLEEIRLTEPAMGTTAIREHFVKEPKDYEILMAWLRDEVVIDRGDALSAVVEGLGEDGLPHVAICRTPFQQLWIEWVCIEDLCPHMVDVPELVNDIIELMVANMRKMFEIVVRAPLPYVVFPDNVTSPVIGERYFRQYCVPYYRELVDMLAGAGRDIPVFVHTDGDLKPIARAIGESGVRGLDSFSPPPDNDTSVAEGLVLWPQMRLGANFPSSVHMAAPGRIYEAACELLEQSAGSGRLQVQISENVPPGVWRKSYPQIVKAIRDYGGLIG